MIKHSNVEGDIKMHKLPVNKERKRAWIAQVSKRRKGFQPPKLFLLKPFCGWQAKYGAFRINIAFNSFNKFSPNTQKRKQPLPRSMKMLNVKDHLVAIILVILK